MIIAEMHHRTSLSTRQGIKNKGNFKPCTDWNMDGEFRQSTNRYRPSGRNGVTYVHLLPSSDYASIDRNKLDENHYNWG